MKPENKKTIYDGIRISVRALTAFILIGLLLMGSLIGYAYLQGNRNEKSMPLTEENTPSECTSWKNRCSPEQGDRFTVKINQKFIDKQ